MPIPGLSDLFNAKARAGGRNITFTRVCMDCGVVLGTETVHRDDPDAPDEVSHGLCPACFDKRMAELDRKGLGCPLYVLKMSASCPLSSCNSNRDVLCYGCSKRARPVVGSKKTETARLWGWVLVNAVSVSRLHHNQNPAPSAGVVFGGGQ